MEPLSIKKRQYCLCCIDGEKTKAHFAEKDVGAVDAIFGDIENANLHVFAMKNEDYVIMLISTYGKNEWLGEDKFRTIGGERTTFQHP